MKKISMLCILVIALIIPMQSTIAQNKGASKGIPTRDVEPFSISYPVRLCIWVINSSTYMPYPGVYIYSERYEYAGGTFVGTKTMALGMTDEIGAIVPHEEAPLEGWAMTYRMKIFLRLPTNFGGGQTIDVPFNTGLTQVYIYVDGNENGYALVKYNDGSTINATLK